jgi:hypothetical protein
MKSSSTKYQSYLLRLWCEKDGAGWRASLENVTTHECHNFPDMVSLFSFLNQQTVQSTASVDPDQLAAHRARETQTPLFVDFFEEEV